MEELELKGKSLSKSLMRYGQYIEELEKDNSPLYPFIETKEENENSDNRKS